MSTGTRHAYAQAMPIAQSLAARLAEHCDAIAIAGGLRRKCATVGDIEIVALATAVERTVVVAPATLFEPEQTQSRIEYPLLEYLSGLRDKHKIEPIVWGERNRRFTLRTRAGREYKVDLFITYDLSAYISALVIRTGSSDFSRWLVTSREQGGALPAGMSHEGGRLLRDGEPVEILTEFDFFEQIGVEYVEPERRVSGLWRQVHEPAA